jgi:MSHA biogenesis protein MshI
MRLSLFKKDKGIHGSVTVDITPSQVTLVQIQYYDHIPSRVVSEIRRYSDISELPDHLVDIVNQKGFKLFDCNIVLHPDYYHLLLVDTPEVPESEYKLALRWQIKGMVNIPAEDLAIDFFKPSASILEYSKKLYVIASKISFLQTIVAAVEKASLNPMIIDVHEFAIRNLFSLIKQTDEPIACLHLLENKSIFFVFENNEIHLARHIPYGTSKFIADEISYDMVMEIKHTLDYYFHQLNKPLPNKIFIPSINNYCPIVLDKLKTALGLDIEYLSINELNIFKNAPLELIQINSYVALGEELRKEDLYYDAKH